jgi:hypothetical protein
VGGEKGGRKNHKERVILCEDRPGKFKKDQNRMSTNEKRFY